MPDSGICNLTPFRGAGADAGTVFELGMLVGLGKKVLVTPTSLTICSIAAG